MKHTQQRPCAAGGLCLVSHALVSNATAEQLAEGRPAVGVPLQVPLDVRVGDLLCDAFELLISIHPDDAIDKIIDDTRMLWRDTTHTA